jgi:hypothetical protein
MHKRMSIYPLRNLASIGRNTRKMRQKKIAQPAPKEMSPVT